LRSQLIHSKYQRKKMKKKVLGEKKITPTNRAGSKINNKRLRAKREMQTKTWERVGENG